MGKKEEMKEEMTLEGLAGCKYADWDCIKESKADCDEDMCDDDDEGCWFGFFIELIELEPKMTDEGKMLGMWGATGCEYMDFECMGKALEDDEDFGCDEDMACWIATLIVLPPCELKDMDCWMAFKKAMMALAKEEGKKGKKADMEKKAGDAECEGKEKMEKMMKKKKKMRKKKKKMGKKKAGAGKKKE